MKAAEAASSVADGADEVDMVIDIGNAISGDWSAVHDDVAAVRRAIPEALLKVIIDRLPSPINRSSRCRGVQTSALTS